MKVSTSHRVDRTRAAGSDLRRKRLILSQRLLDAAREALDAATEAETITRALHAVVDLARFGREVDAGFRALGGKGRFVNHFDDPASLAYTAVTARPRSGGCARR